jgi:hypothetical protein
MAADYSWIVGRKRRDTMTNRSLTMNLVGVYLSSRQLSLQILAKASAVIDCSSLVFWERH